MDRRTAKTPLFAIDGVSWVGLSAGPLAWVFDEQVSYFLAGWSCPAGHRWATYAVSAAALALTVAGMLLSRQDWGGQPSAGDADNRSAARARFLGFVGLLLCLLFGLVVLVDAAAKFAFDPCQR